MGINIASFNYRTFWNDQCYKMSQKLYLNILDPQYARYIQVRDELEEYLIELYGEDIDFQIMVSEPCER
jgi:hypothetical protein